jgi:hypothetical protein
MFVRVKKIKGRPYAYLVENEWTPWGSRQRVTKYLGKTHFLEKLNEAEHELPAGLKNAVIEAAIQELKNHGFVEKEGKYHSEEIVVDLKEKTVRQKTKKAVLSMNEGYMCDHTLQELLNFEHEDHPEKSAKKLASLALESGLKLTNEQFVHLFEQAKEEKK